VVLFFGLIRSYKGLDTLIEACRIVREMGLAPGQRLRLVIAGRPFKNHWQEAGYDALIRDANLGSNVLLEFGHIDMKDLARFFHVADVVALPYKQGSQSGVLRLAYSFRKASVATSVGSLAEVPQHDLTRFVPPEEPTQMAVALREILLDPELARGLGERGRQYADSALGWGDIAKTTRAVYDSLI
jgi:glycosyltransferase involved in cell wall biosynthesis